MAPKPLDTAEESASAEPDKDERLKRDEDRMKRSENR